MAKCRDFSIRLLIDSYNINNVNESFKDEDKRELLIDKNIEKGFIINNQANLVWWSNYFNIKKIYNSTNSFVYFLNIDNRILVFSFGFGYTKIKEEAFEEQFGFKVTLNALDSNKIKSMDLFNPSNNTKQKRVVSSILTNIYDYDYNDDNDFIENISGVVKDQYKDIFKNPTGKNSLKISTSYTKEELIDLGKTLLNLYNSEDYKKDDLFKDINRIKKATKQETQQLNDKFDKILKEGNIDNIFVSDKDIIDPSKFFCYKIADNGEEINNVTFENIRKTIKNLCVNTLKQSYINILSNSDDKYPEKWKIFDCLVYNMENCNKHFYLSKGIWYEIEGDFIKTIETNFSNYLDDTINFPDFTDEHNIELRIGGEYYKEGEGHYNYKVSLTENLDLFDRKTIKLKNNSTLEICDLYDKNNHIFYHIKRGNKSPGLSHLWNQGLNSEQICRLGDNEEYNESFKKFNGIPEKRKIYYGIISEKKVYQFLQKYHFIIL